MSALEMVGKEIVVNNTGKAGWVAEAAKDKILISLYEDPHAIHEVAVDECSLATEQEVPEEFYAVDLSSESGEKICSIRLDASNPVYAEEAAKGQEHFQDFLSELLRRALEQAVADLDGNPQKENVEKESTLPNQDQ